jgi:hypothetical protein
MLKDPALFELSDVVVKVPAAVGEKVKKYWQVSKGLKVGAQF